MRASALHLGFALVVATAGVTWAQDVDSLRDFPGSECRPLAIESSGPESWSQMRWRQDAWHGEVDFHGRLRWREPTAPAWTDARMQLPEEVLGMVHTAAYWAVVDIEPDPLIQIDGRGYRSPELSYVVSLLSHLMESETTSAERVTINALLSSPTTATWTRYYMITELRLHFPGRSGLARAAEKLQGHRVAMTGVLVGEDLFVGDIVVAAHGDLLYVDSSQGATDDAEVRVRRRMRVRETLPRYKRPKRRSDATIGRSVRLPIEDVEEPRRWLVNWLDDTIRKTVVPSRPHVGSENWLFTVPGTDKDLARDAESQRPPGFFGSLTDRPRLGTGGQAGTGGPGERKGISQVFKQGWE